VGLPTARAGAPAGVRLSQTARTRLPTACSTRAQNLIKGMNSQFQCDISQKVRYRPEDLLTLYLCFV
jgi:hypothetical protein